MYAKLFASILDSSVWLEPESTRIVWLTLLAAKDADGFARFATVENLAIRARVTREACERAVKTLESPDPKSTTPEHNGRRIERVPGGWMVLNAQIYDAIAKAEDERAATRERVRRYRLRRKQEAEGGPSTAPMDNISREAWDVIEEFEERRETEVQRLASDQELAMMPQFGEHWETVATFLDTRELHTRPAWVKEIATLHMAYGPETVARACNDAMAAPDPVRMPGALRSICAKLREYGIVEKTGPASKTKSDTEAAAIRAFAAILKLIQSSQEPGHAQVRYIQRRDVERLGPRITFAYDAVGGTDRFLNTPPDEQGILSAQFRKAYDAFEGT